MDDNMSPASSGEEYKISDPEVQGAIPPVAGSTITSRLKQFRAKRAKIIFLIGVTSVVYAGLYWLNKYRQTPPSALTSQVQRHGTGVGSPAPKPKLATSVILAPTKSEAQLQQRLGSLEKTLTSDSNLLTNTKTTVGALQQEIMQLKQTVESLNTQLQGLVAELKENKAQQVKQAKVQTKKLEPYFIRAIIPGRAWLTSDSGKNISVCVGDQIPGYGMVELISPEDGWVLTSNGSYIQYGENDA